jgi:hypothetical protein
VIPEPEFHWKPKQTLGLPLSSPCHVCRFPSSMNPTLVIYALHRARFAQPRRELSLGAHCHHRRRLKLEPHRHVSCSEAPHRLKTPLVSSSHPATPIGSNLVEEATPQCPVAKSHNGTTARHCAPPAAAGEPLGPFVAQPIAMIRGVDTHSVLLIWAVHHLFDNLD